MALVFTPLPRGWRSGLRHRSTIRAAHAPLRLALSGRSMRGTTPSSRRSCREGSFAASQRISRGRVFLARFEARWLTGPGSCQSPRTHWALHHMARPDRQVLAPAIGAGPGEAAPLRGSGNPGGLHEFRAMSVCGAPLWRVLRELLGLEDGEELRHVPRSF